MKLFGTAILLLLLSSFSGLFSRKGSLFWERTSLVFSLTGCVSGMVATAMALAHPEAARFFLPWNVPGAALALKIDGMAAVFLFPALLIIAAGSLYGTGYLPCRPRNGKCAWVRFFYGLLSTAIVLVLAVDNAVLFLVVWEIMALSGYFLVITDRQDDEAHHAGFIYLAATHTGTLALFALFAILLALPGNNLLLPVGGSLDGATGQAAGLFLLALVGFGFKAGIMPMHIWLPKAHAAAPSHVSALMSGVMIKMGIYGIMRVTGFFHAIPPWWGWTVLALGLVSGILGVCYALAQHDIKRLLAYHSVENIGIILLGLGTALLGVAYQVPALVGLGMAGALLHVVNHGLFKGLLFLAGGSMIHATGTRRMSGYGGLLKTMPLTGIFFLGGAIAICGLPPLNGFVSEWLIYLGMLHSGQQPAGGLIGGVLLAVPGLALIGALALLCFSKVFGLCFLGQPRTEAPAPREAPVSMLIAMGLLLAGCLIIGLAPTLVIPLLAAGVDAWQGGNAGGVLFLTDSVTPTGYISLSALLLGLLIITVVLVNRRLPKRTVPRVPTWGCGYAVPLPRTQYTTSSYAQMLTDWGGWILRTRTIRKEKGDLFRQQASFATHTPDMVLDLLITPVATSIARAAERIRHCIQNGIISYYLFYLAIALCALLWLTFIR
jgi:hydrogenase-4 component B